MYTVAQAEAGEAAVTNKAGHPSTPELQPSEGDADLYTALREQLGLKLEVQRAPVAVLVVESAELPAPN